MEVIKFSEFVSHGNQRSVVSIGNYDGVHIGHQRIIADLTARCERKSCRSIVLTFEPHPKKFFSGENTPFLLSSFDEKVALIKKFPVDTLVYFNFDEAFASIAAESFVKDILVKKLNVSEVIVGYNFNFGAGRTGNADFLKRMGVESGFNVSIVTPQSLGGEIISSSHIRNLLMSGDVGRAAVFLGRNYSITGEVIRGKNIGKKIGFPTVNLQVADKLVPSDGVYAVSIVIDGERLKGVANIGYQPTFGENRHSIEAHIIDFRDEIYGKAVTLEFVTRLRSEMRFSGVDELTMQIKNDVESARASLSGIV